MRRTIQAPGIELRETDKSQYNKPDYSIVGTTSLVCGFADKGENYVINWINTIQNFEEVFGRPETEEEKYFYNASNEVLKKGGILLASRLPYINDSKDHFTYVEYQGSYQSDELSTTELSDIAAADPSIHHHFKLQQPDVVTDRSNLMSIEQFDSCKTRASTVPVNHLRIVDMTKVQYEKCKISVSDITQVTSYFDSECLGIMPVIVTPANAMFYQGIISSETSATYDEDGNYLNEETTKLTCYQPLASFCNVKESAHRYDAENFATVLNSKTINDNTVSKAAVSYFPTLSFTDIKTIDNEYLKQIGIVIFQMYNANESSGTKIAFRPVEAFVGSLDKTAKDANGASIFIDTLVNSSSQYVNVFSNFSKTDLQKSDIISIKDQTAASLGFTDAQCQKRISYNDSLIKPLTMIFDNAKDTNKYNIDLLVDAGMSNIAYRYAKDRTDSRTADWTDTPGEKATAIRRWKNILNKCNSFCQFMRKDCMFIADGLRSFCLDGDEKKVRNTCFKNTVFNTIIPELKNMSGVNSSYAAGYCNWFLAYDAFSGERIWLPPSIKTAGIYIYTDAYFNKWDAPAGMSRGKVTDVVDVAFSPNATEAEKIYLQSWNYAVSYPIDGIVTEGQKTFQLKATAFDRVNVRRLFLHLEKEVSRIAKYFLYEGNTEYQRGRFVDAIKPIFENAVNRNGIVEYYIKCDSENNTPQTIDNNELRCSIAVKPVKTIEFIVLNFVCTNQSAVVTEVLANQ